MAYAGVCSETPRRLSPVKADPVVNVRAFVAHVALRANSAAAAPSPCADENRGTWRMWQEKALTVWFSPRQDAAPEKPVSRLPVLFLGDDSERGSDVDANLAAGVPVRYERASGKLIVHTSIVGLPPVYLYRGPHAVAMASDLHLLKALPGVHLELDPAGVCDLGRYGRPIERRTLFKNVERVETGGRLELSRCGAVAFTRSWQLPHPDPLGRQEFIELQVERFVSAMRGIDVGNSFLSLTGGLDTRTLFATLADQARLIPAVTMTASRLSLDARIASRLCRAYGIRHERITVDERFTRDLPRLVEIASRLSGGIAGLDQAHEIYFYEQVGTGFSARLSGNLGNQVGRGGTEGVSLRGADLSVLAEERFNTRDDAAHWMAHHLRGDEPSRLRFILEHEVATSSAANFSIGNYYVVQHSPYASRALIETLAHRPLHDRVEPSSDSVLRMRLRDLKHRFFGENRARSFQRTLIARIGGTTAAFPINWGWCPSGGISPSGFAQGFAALLGMAARAKGLDDGILRRPLAWSGLAALHDFRESRRWLREDLREFTLDTLGSQAIRESNLFHHASLDKILLHHFRNRRDHYNTITFALDLALAHRYFCSRGP